jgi:hypothetical protein
MRPTPRCAAGAPFYFLLCATLTMLTGCRVEGRSSRAQSLLSGLAPSLKLGESLADARHAVPGLRVRRPGDATELGTQSMDSALRPVAVIVSPEPSPLAQAAPDAAVEGVEFEMTPETASELRQRIAALFRGPGSRACAERAGATVDSIVQWNLDIRGGALLTFPSRRPVGAAARSHLFVYTGAWRPSEGLPGYRAAACDSAR